MVCKEEICAWFKDLCAPKRIDLMCGLLHMCLPLELRFIGSCLEDLAKKDYHSLRDAENKANDSSELKKLTDVFDNVIRSKLNVYLALLHSDNIVCSNIMCSTLTNILPSLRAMPNPPNDSKFAEELALSLTMAAYHPAFTFSQRQILSEHLDSVQRIFGSLFKGKEPCPESSSHHVHPESGPPSRASPEVNGTHQTHQTHHPSHHQHTTSTNQRTVYVQNIELKGSPYTDRRYEFHIQVTWSNGEVTEVRRTYQELHNFHVELIRQFPKDSGAHKQDRQIPFLPQEKSSHTVTEMREQISKYIRQIAVLPEHIVQSHHVTSFFRLSSVVIPSHHTHMSQRPRPGPAPRSQSPLVTRNPHEEPVTPSGHVKTLTIYNSHINPALKANRENSSRRSPGVPVMSTVTNTRNQRAMYTAGLPSTPSPQSSPLPSPLSSPHVSPSPSIYSNGSRSESPHIRDPFDLSQWLHNCRLHKYNIQLSKYSIQELLSLTENDLANEGLTKGARKKFLKEIETLRRKLPNGVIPGTGTGQDLGGPGSSSPSSPAASWHTPPPCSGPYNNPASPAGPVHALFQGSTSSVDTSPAGSECYSPPPSPGTDQDKHGDSPSSEEADKDSEGSSQVEHLGRMHIPQPARMVLPARQEGSNNNNNTFLPIQNQHLPEVLPPQFQSNFRMMHIDPHLMYYAVRGHPLRAQRPAMKPLPVPNTVGAPLLPSPKLGGNSCGPLIYESSHQLAALNKTGSPLSFQEISTNTTSVMTVTMSSMSTSDCVTTSYKGGMPLGFVPCSVMANTAVPPPPTPPGAPVSRPSTLGIHVPGNIPVTYSVASIGKSQSLPVDGGMKPPTGPLPPPAGTPLVTPISSASEGNLSGFTVYPSIGSTQTSTSITYAAPGFHGGSAPPTPVATPTPNAGGPTPTHTPTPTPVPPHSSSGNGCSSCGCNGHCSVGSTSNNGPNSSNTFQYTYPMWPHHPHMFHSFPPGMFHMPLNSNGLLTPGAMYSHHPVQGLSLPNGLSHDVIFNNHPNLMLHSATTQNPSYIGGAGGGFSPGVHNPTIGGPNQTGNGSKTKPTCSNCGSDGHRAFECKESTMESMSNSGQFHLNYRPKSDSD